MSVEAVAKRLVELCRAGEFEVAQRELYAQGAVSIEPDGAPMGNVQGLEAILKKGEGFRASLEAVHGIEVSEPLVAGTWFSVVMSLDVTMAQFGRQLMTEVCVYHVRDGKVDREQFFYDMG